MPGSSSRGLMSWIDEYHVKLIALEQERDRWKQVADLFADAVFADHMGRITTESGRLSVAHRAWVDEVRRDADCGRA